MFSVGDVEAYLRALPDGAERAELHRLDRLIRRRVPGLGETTSYSMPCYTYRGVPVAAVIVRRRHLAWYPYSGDVLGEVAERLTGYSHSSGTLRFTASTPLPDDLVEDLLVIRMRLIDRVARPGDLG